MLNTLTHSHVIRWQIIKNSCTALFKEYMSTAIKSNPLSPTLKQAKNLRFHGKGNDVLHKKALHVQGFP